MKKNVIDKMMPANRKNAIGLKRHTTQLQVLRLSIEGLNLYLILA
jgi:hypothetical protein